MIIAMPAAAAHPVAITCENKAVTRPVAFMLACGDGTDALIMLSWDHWGLEHAEGHGTEAIDDCVPDCAHGSVHSYAVDVVFWGSAAVKDHPTERRYTRYALVYTGAHHHGDPTQAGYLPQ